MSAGYFAERHAHLKDDYSDSSGQYVDSCGLIAIKMGILLRSEGKRPHIFVIKGEFGAFGCRALLEPTPFEGRVPWGEHAICEADGLAYDPIHETPMVLAQYLKDTFRQNVELQDRTDILDRYWARRAEFNLLG
jgi:hypothetical protein